VAELLSLIVGACGDKLSACPEAAFGTLRKYAAFGISSSAAHSLWRLGKGDSTHLIALLGRDMALAPYLEVASSFARIISVYPCIFVKPFCLYV
jgi:hypothetical protein